MYMWEQLGYTVSTDWLNRTEQVADELTVGGVGDNTSSP